MIEYVTGDILEDDAEALVNTVNTVGVMGKGIALQFKRRFPGNYEAYRKACEAEEVDSGKMFVWHTGQLGNPQYIINFPTKRHWKSKSRIEDIEAGLRDLQRVILDLRIDSIAVPPLGCGNGGLDWAIVGPLIDRALRNLESVNVRLYEPAGAPKPASMPANPRKPSMTAHRAAMLVAFDRYLQPGFTLGRLEAQKLIYFLKVAGAPFERLTFSKGPYGPYSDGIRHVLNHVEGHFIEGFGDADAPSSIRLLEGPVAEAEALLQEGEYEEFRTAVESLASFVEGFDDAFGLELLASVHWVATRDPLPATSATEAVHRVHEWSERKRRRYDERQIRAAWRRLVSAGLIAASDPEQSEASTRDSERLAPEPQGNLVGSAL